MTLDRLLSVVEELGFLKVNGIFDRFVSVFQAVVLQTPNLAPYDRHVPNGSFLANS